MAPDIASVLVTRGDVDLAPILNSLPREWEKVVWDNSRRDRDLSVYGRYAAIAETEAEFIYVQDDDCVLEDGALEALVREAFSPRFAIEIGEWVENGDNSPTEVEAAPLATDPMIVTNMPEPFRAHYTDSCLIGFGAIFHRDLPEQAFRRFMEHHHITERGLEGDLPPEWATIHRCCDVVFTALTRSHWVDVPYRNLEYATADSRMYRQPDHVSERARMLDLAREVRYA